jgi:two-component system sensor histidine kinase/response regulator
MSASRYQLLIVDDDQLILELVKVRLGGYNYDVSTAGNGAAALQRIAEKQWDLVLLDITMPGQSGLEVLERIRQEHCLLSLPIIMMTSHDSPSQIVEALEIGANDYLIKPLDFDVAKARIRTQITCKELAATKDEFLSIASHDLKKPLMLMEDIAGGLHDHLVSGSADIEQARQDVEYLMRTAHHMGNVVEGFLNQEAIKSGAIALEKCRVRPGDIVEKVVQNNSVYAQSKGISVQSSCPTNMPETEVDVEKIEGVVDNLVGNAIKFSPANTKVQVCTRTDGEHVYIEVVDAGPGLSDSDLSKLFTKYARLSNKPTGRESSSGIGLSICRFMIEQHGGRIGAKNNADVGATFWLSLPIVTRSSSSDGEAAAAQELSRLDIAES